MSSKRWPLQSVFAVTVISCLGQPVLGQADRVDPIKDLVSRLSLESYKQTIQGLAQFGDRRQGTQRNEDALDWIEEQLKAVGCSNTERLDYIYDPR